LTIEPGFASGFFRQPLFGWLQMQNRSKGVKTGIKEAGVEMHITTPASHHSLDLESANDAGLLTKPKTESKEQKNE